MYIPLREGMSVLDAGARIEPRARSAAGVGGGDARLCKIMRGAARRRVARELARTRGVACESVNAAGASCGHALSILQKLHRGRLRAMGVDGATASIEYARGTTYAR